MKKHLLFLCFLFFVFIGNNYAQELWGMTSQGGSHNNGVIFKTDIEDNSQEVKFNFDIIEGKAPQYNRLCQATNGKLYGMTERGGTNDKGVLFEYDPATDTYIIKLDFDGSIKGSYPYGSLMQASSGKLYGMTSEGGLNNKGVLFEYDPTTETYTKKLDFDGSNKGSYPYGSLMQASSGKLYGMTSNGGTNDKGVLFEYDPTTDIYTKKLDFDGSNNGRIPYGSLMQASNGKLYGMTASGGTNSNGVLFEYDPTTETYTKKLDFDGSNKGGYPYGSLTQASNGKLYGMTRTGGDMFSAGTLFEFDPATDTYTKKHVFEGFGDDGREPYGSLMQATNGKLYGMTASGGTYNDGVLFEYDPATDNYTKKLDFDETMGSEPYGSLMQASNGKLYGMTSNDGTDSHGVLFEFDHTTATYTKKLDFGGRYNGSYPVASLMLASNGRLYGMTNSGGKNDKGVLFEYDPTAEAFTTKLDFNGMGNGSRPKGSLMQATNEKIYGLTKSGGTNDKGVLFEYDPTTDAFSKKLDFDGIGNGEAPIGTLIQASNGKLYGMTEKGGMNGIGVLFEYDPNTNTIIKKLDFDGTNKGSRPKGSLIQASNGKLYGMTEFGGTINYGVIFEYDIATDVYTKKLDFDGTVNGSNPIGSLVQVTSGKFYGVTYFGGTNNTGVLFEFDAATNTCIKKLDLTYATDGYYPISIMQASNGKMYFMTTFAVSGDGAIFEYNPITETHIIKQIFTGANGKWPSNSNLLEIVPCENPTNPGIIAGNQSICPNSDPNEITSTNAASGESGTLEYKWQLSTTNATSGFSDIANSNSETYAPSTLATTTWYKRLARVDCEADWSGAVESNVVEIITEDVTDPVFSWPASINVESDAGLCGAVVTYSIPTATDNCPSNSGSQTFNYTGAIETFIVPAGVTSLTIEAYGAQGGGGINGVTGGLGAYVSGDFTVTPGESLSILVGGQGIDGVDDGPQAGGTGGGGSFVADAANNPLIVAGGGGGAMGRNGMLGNGGAGQITEAGQDGEAFGGAGGTAGNGGGTWSWTGWHSGTGGGGFYTDGSANSNGNESYYGTVNGKGIAFVNGGAGGFAGSMGRAGGFGGGGAAGFTGGGGGGYSGGGSGTHYNPDPHSGGGGGSYNGGTNTSASAGANSGNGSITITWSSGVTIAQTDASGYTSGDVFPIGTTTLEYTATDGSGNTSACTFEVTVSDVTAPDITCPAEQDLFIGPGCEVALPDYSSLVIASDDCGIASIIQDPIPGTVYTGSDVGSNNVEFSVTDNNGNVSICSTVVNVIDPEAFTIDDVQFTNVLCNGANDGIITVLTTGGLSGLSYSITSTGYSDMNTTGEFTGVPPGDYSISVTNVNDCSDDTWPTVINIAEPTHLIIDDVIATNVTGCFGNNNATIEISASGGTTTYEYSIDNQATWSTSKFFDNLAAGTYDIFVRDANGCVTGWGITIAIVEPAQVLVNDIDIVHITDCYGDLTGEIHIEATGGTGVLSYSIDSGATFFDNNGDFTGLAAGFYDIVIIDENGCDYTAASPTIITQPLQLIVNDVDVTDVTECYGNMNGELDISAVGGTGTILYSINGGNTFVDNGGLFENLAGGDYNVFITDDNGCIGEYAMNPVTIGQPVQITMTVTSGDINGCAGNNDGFISIVAAGGSGVYTYSIDGGNTWNSSANFTGLTADSYEVWTQDDLGCMQPYAANPVVITEPDLIVFNDVIVTDLGCFGADDGEIFIDGAGGTGLLMYSIDGGANYQTNGSFTDLAAGEYNLFIMDDNGCVVAYGNNPVVVDQPNQIIVSDVEVENESCSGSLGSITITASGGAGNLMYSVDNGNTYQSSNFFGNLPADTYVVKVKDGDGCEEFYPENPVTILDLSPSTVVINANPGTEVCTGTNVTLTANAFDAVSYTWSTGETGTEIIVNETEDGIYDYTCVVINEDGCESEETISVEFTNGSEISITVNPEQGPYCINDPVELQAFAENAISYEWQPGGFEDETIVVTSDEEGTVEYSVTVTNSFGCESTATVDITYDICSALTELDSEVMNIHVYPNPNNGIFTLEINGISEEVQITLLDFAGKLIMEEKIEHISTTKFEKQYDLNNQARGVYFFRITHNAKVNYKKVIVN